MLGLIQGVGIHKRQPVPHCRPRRHFLPSPLHVPRMGSRRALVAVPFAFSASRAGECIARAAPRAAWRRPPPFCERRSVWRPGSPGNRSAHPEDDHPQACSPFAAVAASASLSASARAAGGDSDLAHEVPTDSEDLGLRTRGGRASAAQHRVMLKFVPPRRPAVNCHTFLPISVVSWRPPIRPRRPRRPGPAIKTQRNSGILTFVGYGCPQLQVHKIRRELTVTLPHRRF